MLHAGIRPRSCGDWHVGVSAQKPGRAIEMRAAARKGERPECVALLALSAAGPAAPIILDALRRLEYRGYDSAGIATLVNGHIERRRAEGKLGNLAASLERQPLTGTIGIGHTRWATHGAPTESNAHPHGTARVSLVHNGIIENHAELRAELEAEGQAVQHRNRYRDGGSAGRSESETRAWHRSRRRARRCDGWRAPTRWR